MFLIKGLIVSSFPTKFKPSHPPWHVGPFPGWPKVRWSWDQGQTNSCVWIPVTCRHLALHLVVAPPNPNSDHHRLSTKHYGLKCLGISSLNLGSSELWKKEHDLWGPARPGSIFIVLPTMVWLRTLAPELSRTGFKYYSAISYLCDFRQIP